MSLSLVDLVAIAFAAMLSAGLLFVIAGRFEGRLGVRPQSTPSDQTDRTAFLFENGLLIDATPDAAALIGFRAQRGGEYQATVQALETQFPQLRETLADANDGQTELVSVEDPSIYLGVYRNGQFLRLTLQGRACDQQRPVTNTLVREAELAELSLLRDVSQNTPQLIWLTDPDGQVVWANDAYQTFAGTVSTESEKAIFADLISIESKHNAEPQRVSVTQVDDDAAHWFDVTGIPRDDGVLFFATDANSIMRADTQRRDFVKTLGKTFAQLAIGLAIFDKNRQLVMFNPALHELTRLPIEFLSALPTIDMVLDRLRQSHIMPEPKNYTSWRDSFTAVEAQAKNGTFSESWTLPDGQTYRVTGRPHPDGAFAFLFEDITSEISLTRRFRSDIETSQAVLDTIEDAIAVFTASGTMVMSNLAYSRLWATQQDLLLDHRELQSEMAIWQERCIPTPMWNRIRNFIQQLGTRKSWWDDAMLDDGRHLNCLASPLAGGMTMVRFVIAPPMRPVVRKLDSPQLMMQRAKR